MSFDLIISGLDDFFACVHLAGKAHDLKNTTEEKEYFEINNFEYLEFYVGNAKQASDYYVKNFGFKLIFYFFTTFGKISGVYVLYFRFDGLLLRGCQFFVGKILFLF